MNFTHVAVQQFFRCKQCKAFPEVYTKEIATDYGYIYYSCFVYCKSHPDSAHIAEGAPRSSVVDSAIHGWNEVYGQP